MRYALRWKYSKIPIISTVPIKRTPLNFSSTSRINVHYNLEIQKRKSKCSVLLNVVFDKIILLSYKRTLQLDQNIS